MTSKSATSRDFGLLPHDYRIKRDGQWSALTTYRTKMLVRRSTDGGMRRGLHESIQRRLRNTCTGKHTKDVNTIRQPTSPAFLRRNWEERAINRQQGITISHGTSEEICIFWGYLTRPALISCLDCAPVLHRLESG